MNNIAVIVNKSKDPDLEYTIRVVDYLCSKGYRVLCEEDLQVKDKCPQVLLYSFEKIFEDADAVVALGGDGTILRCASYTCKKGLPLIGINLGRIGFMAALEVEDLDLLDSLLRGSPKLERRMMLKVEVIDCGKVIYEGMALNDAVIGKNDNFGIINLEISSDGEKITAFRADGVIAATPTGSTAYSMSAGGPIVDPSVENIIVTPICAHTLFARAIVFKPTSTIELIANALTEPSSILHVDGQTVMQLKSHQIVRISKSERYTYLISRGQHSFYDVLSKKMTDRRF